MTSIWLSVLNIYEAAEGRFLLWPKTVSCHSDEQCPLRKFSCRFCELSWVNCDAVDTQDRHSLKKNLRLAQSVMGNVLYWLLN